MVRGRIELPTFRFSGEGLAGEHERDGPLDGCRGAVAGLPVPDSCFASSIATSIAHLAAYLSMTRAVPGSFSVVTRARSQPVLDLSRMRMTVTGTVPVTEYHRQVNACAAMVSVLP